MAALSDFLEDRLLEIALGQSHYQVPFVIRVTAVDDTATYTVEINGTSYDYPAVGGDDEAAILSGLESLISAGADPVTVTTFTDMDGVEALRIAQDASYAALRVSVSATGTGTLSVTQEVYAALYTSAVGDDASGTEVSGVGYTREALPFASVSSGTASSSLDVTFGPAGAGGWGTITHAAIFDAYSGGNLLFHGALAASKDVLDTDTFTFLAGQVTVSLD